MAIVRGRSKKKVFGRKRASYDARMDEFVLPNAKRIPRDVRLGGDAITPDVRVDREKGGKRDVDSRSRSSSSISRARTVPTVATTTGDELDFRTNESKSRKHPSRSLVDKSSSSSSSTSSERDKRNVPPTGTATAQTTGHYLLTAFKVDTDVSSTSSSNEQLASTRKRLTYGFQEKLLDQTISSHDVTMTLLAEKSTSIDSQYDVIAAKSRKSTAKLTTKSKPLRTTNTTTNKRKNSTRQRGSDRSMMCNNPITERKVFGDRKPSVKSNPTEISKTSEALTGIPRSKSARKKQKLSMPISSIERTQESPPPSTCSKFFVPAYGQHENGGYQDQKHFGLIEGMGGGEEEIERQNDKPHRGRLMELPGSVMPGMWEANVRNNDVATNRHAKLIQEKLQDLSLSLRHTSASSTPLEKYYNGEEPTPSGLVVSMIDPSFNRISSFIKQGVFTNEEVDFCVDGEEKMLNSSFLSCLLLVTFDGFTSASDSTNDADDFSEAMLARCAWPIGDRQFNGRHEVHMFGGDNESEATGVLFPCKLDFVYEYYILVSHDSMFRISAIDVIFRKPEASRVLSAPHVRLTESVLSEHRLSAGSGVGEIMERFIAQQSSKSNSEVGQSVEDRKAFDVDNFHPVEDVVQKDETFSLSWDHGLERTKPTNSTYLVACTIQREWSDNRVPYVKGGIEFGRCHAEGGNHPITDEHENNDNNLVFDDPMNSIKDHLVINDHDRDHSINGNETAFTDPCIDFETNNESPKSAGDGVDKTKPRSSELDGKTRLYSRLSNICRKSVQSHRRSGKTVRKRGILYSTDLARKRLRRASTIGIDATPTQGTSPSRKANISDRRTSFPSSSRVLADTAGSNSSAEKTRAVAVVDLFGETESLFGCAAISRVSVDKCRKFVKQGTFFQENDIQSVRLELVSVDNNLVRTSGTCTSAKFNDATVSSEESKEDNEVVTYLSTGNDTSDEIFLPNDVEQKGDVLAMTSFDNADTSSMAIPAVGNDSVTDLFAADHAEEDKLYSIRGESFSIECIDDDHMEYEATPTQSVSTAQPIYDICFGHENDQSTLLSSSFTSLSFVNDSQPFHDQYYGQESVFGTHEDEVPFFQPPQSIHFESDSSMHSIIDINSLNNQTPCTNSQPFHDHYFGQEVIGVGYKDQHAYHSLRDVCFGLYDDNDSSTQSPLDLASLTSPMTNVPHYDYYFGQEEILIEDVTNNMHGTEKSVRIPRRVVKSQQLFVLVLLAGILTKSY